MDEHTIVTLVINTVILSFFGFWTAKTAGRSGKYYLYWFIYGFILTVIAVIHAYFSHSAIHKWVARLVMKCFEPKPLSPEMARKAAGLKAEEYVSNSLFNYIKSKKDNSHTLNNSLFVFNAGLSTEYSAEADHILITAKNIYLIETKFKSGRIEAVAENEMWRVSSNGFNDEMRNALLQAKNTIKILSKEFHLCTKIIPIVAIYGTNVSIINGPSNVVPADKLIELIQVFERSTESDLIINVESISALFLTKCNKDPGAFKNHVDRINKKKEIHQINEVIKAASLD